MRVCTMIGGWLKETPKETLPLAARAQVETLLVEPHDCLITADHGSLAGGSRGSKLGLSQAKKHRITELRLKF